MESSIQKRATSENQNSIDAHCSIFPVYYADLDDFRLVNERILIRKGKGEKIMKSQVLNITGGFYTAVVVKFELFESRIRDISLQEKKPKHFRGLSLRNVSTIWKI